MVDLISSSRAAGDDCGLYVHTPFCETKCGYCDFFSVVLKGRATEPVVAAIVAELTKRTQGERSRIRTVFVGGGTPTLLPIEQLERLLTTIGECVETDQLDEFCVEANPATIDSAVAALLVSAGVTRVSLGAQSFLPAELAALERIHHPEDIAPSVDFLRRAGIAQINLDLIFGIPGQTLATWLQSLQAAIDLGADHLACYGLTYEPGTKLTAQRQRGLVDVCEEDLEAELFLATIDTLENAGYAQYEISNFAKPGCQSKHNLLYWKNRDYIGVGPSAVGMVNGTRYRNVPDIHRYVAMMNDAGDAEVESESITRDMLIYEIILMRLRLNEGIDIAEFHQRTGVDPRELFLGALAPLVDRGLIKSGDKHISLTHTGRLVANSVMIELAVAADLKESGVHSRA